MNEPQYYRVNVSSTTSTPVYNEFGDKCAEVEMQLPANILPSNNIRSARMALMKMEVSVAKVPFLVIPVDGNLGTKFHTRCCIGFLPGHYNYTTGRYVKNEEGPTKVQNWTRMSVHCPHHEEEDPDLAIRKTLESGYCEFSSVESFADWISRYLSEVLPGTPNNRINLVVNEDNTFTLICNYSKLNPTYVPEYSQRDLQMTENKDCMFLVENITDVSRFVSPPQYVGYFVGNEFLAEELPSLPWKKIAPWWDDGTSMFDGAPPEDYIYILDTKESTFSQEYSSYLVHELFESANLWYKYSIFKYKFPTSDVVTCSDISSIVLCMNGAAFNQMVYPVNMTRLSATQAQTSMIPIIDVFYPFWTRPSDTKTDLIIVKENFSSSAPCNINPSLLRERSIKFKLYYITNNGVMREMYIPKHTNFSFQLCFELFTF